MARLWTKANARFDEIAPLISGTPRLWGLMTGPNRDFLPWEAGFSRGPVSYTHLDVYKRQYWL